MAVIDGTWLSKEGLTYFWSKIKAIFTKQTETNVIANLGAKNLLNNKFLHTASGTGVTIVSNGDGTYSLSGTATGTATYLYTSATDVSSLYGIETGKSYTITAGSNKVLIRIDYSTNGTSWDNGEDGQPLVSNIAGEATFMVPASTIGLYIRFRSTASHGSLNGVILKPMIRHAEITDSTFVPYAPTNRELYETSNVIANLGAKNLLKITSSSQTIKGVTFTVNDDQTVTVNGTNTGTSTALFVIEDIPLPAGIAYTLSGCPSGGSEATYYIGSLDTTDWKTFTTDIGNGGTATLNESKTIRFRIGIRSGVTVNNLVFKPMLRRAEITDDTFEPYAPTNRELYETRFASKTILPNNVDLNDIKTGGIYNGVNSTGNSAVHMPVATGSFNFVLTVIEANEFIIQIFKQLNSAGDPNFYVRRFYIYNSDWDSWYQFTGTQV